MNSLTVLVVEDDDAIRRGVVDALRFQGFTTREARDGTEGLHRALTVRWDLLLLDLVLPGMDGLEILKEVRKALPTSPVIVLTARGSEDDRVRGLKLGADDYVVKPFSVKELLARVEAVLRRTPGRPLDVDEIQLGDVLVRFAMSAVEFADGTRKGLTNRETTLLRYLVTNPNRVITREELISRVWGLSPRGLETRAVDMHVARLRSKLRLDGDSEPTLETVRGKGYAFRTIPKKGQ